MWCSRAIRENSDPSRIAFRGRREGEAAKTRFMAFPKCSRRALVLGLLALPACDDPERNEQIAGASVGAAFGAVAAQAFGANEEWTVVGALAGAAAGTLIAQNNNNNDQCAYADGRGGYYTAPC